MKRLGFVVGSVLLASCAREPARDNRVAASFHAEELPEDHKVDLSKRQVFPFSVVAGGTVTRDEVRTRVASDAVVREHYKGIQIDKLKPFRLTKPAQGFVSYRIGNRIFWTAKRLYLKPGEILLSDGANMIRGRCGNRISLDPAHPVLPAGEPTEAALDLPSYDVPIYQALMAEASRGATDPAVFSLPPNGAEPMTLMPAKVPESAFQVAPPVVGPGMIGGGFPGGLPANGNEGGIVLETGYYFVFPYQPAIFENPTFSLPVLTPFPIVVPDLPVSFVNNLPIGIGHPVVVSVPGGIPFLPGPGIAPPTFTIPPHIIPSIIASNPTPPLVVSPPGVVPPPDSTVPPTTPIVPPVGPPDSEPPPVFAPIPEPSTLWMVGLAAVAVGLIRRRL